MLSKKARKMDMEGIIDRCVRLLMISRRGCELEGSMTGEEFDEIFKDKCERYWMVYSDMGKAEFDVRLLVEMMD